MCDFNFAGKRALVTGSSRGIGLDIVKKLHAAGANVVSLARSKEKVAEGVSDCIDGVKCVTGDLADLDSLRTAVRAAIAELAGLDILIISGGNGGSEYLGKDPDAPESYSFLSKIHVEATLVLVQEAEAALVESKGNVVVVSSMASDIPWPQTQPYNVAKGAQHTLIKNLALKYVKHGVRVNCVLPGAIHTEALDIMAAKKGVTSEEYALKRGAAHPMQRCGATEEVSNAALFLASPLASFICGHFLAVDGGLSLTNWFNTSEMMNYGGQSE